MTNINLKKDQIVQINALNFNFNNFLISSSDFVKNFGKDAPKHGNHPYKEINTDPSSYVAEDKVYRTETLNGLLIESKKSGYQLVKVESKLWSEIKSAITDSYDHNQPIVDEIIGDLYEVVHISTEPTFTLDGVAIPSELGAEIEMAHRRGIVYDLSETEFTMNYED